MLCGQEGHFGTNSFNIVLSMRMMQNLKAYDYEPEKTEQRDDMFGDIEDGDDPATRVILLLKTMLALLTIKIPVQLKMIMTLDFKD